MSIDSIDSLYQAYWDKIKDKEPKESQNEIKAPVSEMKPIVTN